MNLIETHSLGECWLQVSKLIMSDGELSRYDSAVIKEIANLSLTIESPDPNDKFIQQNGDASWLQWMHNNFFVQKEVAELGNTPSYAIRLFNYADQQRDQIQWVVDRLRTDPENKSAAITTFMPLTDSSYIPCISLLDFWIRSGLVELIVYAHSLDFGKKAYGNLIELASLQSMVADQLQRSMGPMIIHVKSAHIYKPEWATMQNLIEANS